MTDESSEKSGMSRRRFLGAAAGLSGAAAIGAYAGVQLTNADVVTTDKLSDEIIAFRGVHQAGVTTPSPAAAILAAFDVTAPSRKELEEIFTIITKESEPLTQAQEISERNNSFAPHDNLVNGNSPRADGLTITVSVGATLFDERFGLADKKPRSLDKMPHFPNDRIDPARTHGDLLIQICAHHTETCLRALRILMKATRSGLVLRWMEQGFIQPNTLGTNRTSTRNLLGFKDGTANLDSEHDQLMNDMVWVSKDDDEPAWTAGGSYVVVRTIRMFVEHWDRTSLSEQEQIMGRTKDSGAPIGSKNETDTPTFHQHPTKDQIHTQAHIRLANPRTETTEKNRILRRGFNFSRGFDSSGHLDQGLLFICFQRNLTDGFLTVQERLNGEPLEEYIQPNGGGFFFTLPGIEPAEDGGYLGAQLFA